MTTPPTPSRHRVRIELPASLCRLSGAPQRVELSLDEPVTQRSVLDALEQRYPTLAGTLRDHTTGLRRPFIRFFASGEDLSHQAPEAPLPQPVVNGSEPYLIIGAIAGG